MKWKWQSNSLYYCRWMIEFHQFNPNFPGGFRLDIILVHMVKARVKGLSNHTLSTYFPGTKIERFCVLFFVIFPSCPLQIFWTWPKNTPFFPICARFCNPKHVNNVRAYTARSWKAILITWFFFPFLRGWYPTSNTSDPGPFIHHVHVMTLLINEILKYSTVYNLNNFMYQTNRVRKEHYKLMFVGTFI